MHCKCLICNPESPLSVRERQVCQRLLCGKSNKEIVDELCITRQTLSGMMRTIGFKKLKLQTGRKVAIIAALLSAGCLPETREIIFVDNQNLV